MRHYLIPIFSSYRIRVLRAERDDVLQDDDRMAVLSHWYYLPILEMPKLEAESFTPRTASQRFGISRLEGELAFERLVQVGLIKKTAEGGFVRSSGHLLSISQV